MDAQAQLVAVADLQDVEARLQPEERLEHLGDDQRAGGQVQQHAVLERADPLLAVDVEPDVGAPQHVAQLVAHQRVRVVREVELVLERDQRLLAVHRRVPDEDDPRRPARRSRRTVEAVVDRQRHRAPQRHQRGRGVPAVRVEGDDPVDVAAVDLGQLGQVVGQVGMGRGGVAGVGAARERLGEEAEDRRGDRRPSFCGGRISGRKTTTACGSKRRSASSIGAVSAPPRKSMNIGCRPPAGASSEHASKYVRWPDERDAHRDARLRRRVGQLVAHARRPVAQPCAAAPLSCAATSRWVPKACRSANRSRISAGQTREARTSSAFWRPRTRMR